MSSLTTGLCSEKCIIRWFYLCVNVVEGTYTNIDGIAYYTPGCYVIAYGS